MTDLELITRSEWNLDSCHCAECQRVEAAPGRDFSGWLLLLAVVATVWLPTWALIELWN